MDKIKVAIVEDDLKEYRTILSLLDEYQKENNVQFAISYFSSGGGFLDSADICYDLIFMDIEMPGLDGLETSRKIREIDKNVPIIIVSYSAKYAVKGYYVQAAGYLVKPVSKFDFNFLLKKVLDNTKYKKNSCVMLESRSEVRKIMTNDILYIEIKDHYLSFHLKDEQTIRIRGKISDYAQKLESVNFIRCNECYLVNLLYVKQIDVAKNIVYVGDKTLTMSKQKKKAFVDGFTNFLGENI